MAARKRVSAAALAVRWFVTPQAVHDLVKRGRLTPPGPDGLFDLELADAEYGSNLRPRTNDRVPTAPAAACVSDEPDAGAGLSAPASVTYSASKARIAHLQAQRLEMELRQFAGELLVASDVSATLREAVTTFRREAEQLTQRLPARLAALGADEGAIEALLASEIEEMLWALSRELEKLGAPRREAA